MKDGSTKIILSPRWVLMFVFMGWFFVVLGVFLLLSVVVTLADVAVFTWVGVPFILFGIWLAGLGTKMSWQPGSKYITVTRGMFPIFLSPLRTKRISRAEAQRAVLQTNTHKWGTMTGQVVRSNVYSVNVPLLRGGTLTIASVGRNERRAVDLVRRIRNFARQ